MLFARMYPCHECGDHFVKKLKKNPFNGENNDDFIMWVCSLHNDVNKMLNKPIFKCSLENIKSKMPSVKTNEEKAKFGRITWQLFHLMTVFAPKELFKEKNKNINKFYDELGQFYPIPAWRKVLSNSVKATKPFTGTTDNHLIVYGCKIHNGVNKQINRKEFPCKWSKRAWGKVGCGCQPEQMLKFLENSKR